MNVGEGGGIGEDIAVAVGGSITTSAVGWLTGRLQARMINRAKLNKTVLNFRFVFIILITSEREVQIHLYFKRTK